MIIKKDLCNNNLYFIEDNVIVFRVVCIGGEVVIIKSTNKPIVITEKDDKYLYNNLLWLLHNKYDFDNSGLSYMTNNKIVWFSDQYCDIENKEETEKIERISLDKSYESIIINCHNPFCEKQSIKKSQSVVSLSPSGNGFYSRNLETNQTFQDDFIIAILKAIKDEYISKKETVEKKVIKKHTK